MVRTWLFTTDFVYSCPLTARLSREAGGECATRFSYSDAVMSIEAFALAAAEGPSNNQEEKDEA